LLLPHDGAGLPGRRGVQVAGQGVGHQPVPGGFVRVAQVEAVFIEPAADVLLVDEVEEEPVVAQAAGVGNAVVVAGFIATRLPIQAGGLREPCQFSLRGCFQGIVPDPSTVSAPEKEKRSRKCRAFPGVCLGIIPTCCVVDVQ
jgi:hypothetical protein